MPINPMDYSSKDTVLDVARTERAKFYSIIDDPKTWYVQTRCSEWEVRDMVGHMIDVTEGYLTGWDMARKGETGNPLGLEIMSERLNDMPRHSAVCHAKKPYPGSKGTQIRCSLFSMPSPLKSGWAPPSLIPTWVPYQPASIPPSKSSTMEFTHGI